MKTTLKNNLSNFSLVFLLTLISFNSCSKDEIISTPQKQGQIKVEIKESIDNIDLKNQIDKNLSKIKQLFEIAPPKSMRKFNGKSARNDTILEHIQVNTEAYNSIENRNGKVSYTFQVDFPSDSTNVGEIINLHTYYDENNQLKSQLIKYELTNEEFLIATNNQSFDGFWDKIFYLDLETTEIDSNSKRNTSARSGDPCTCGDDNSTPTVIWVPHPNNSGYGGSSASGVGYVLPPLNSLPPHVMATLQAAGVFTGINYNNFAPYGYGHNYTTPVLNFSTNDLTIPAYNPSSPATPFNNYYAYYFSGIKNIIKDYYEKVYVSQINSYVTSSQTTLEDHIVKQKAVYDFFKFTYELYAQNRTQFYYLSSNHELTKSIFNLLAENNTGSLYQYNQAKTFAKSAIQFIITNPQFNFKQYENWFGNNYPDLVPNNPVVNPDNITYETPIIQQSLPSFNDFINHFPKKGTQGNYTEMSTSEVYYLVGGSLLTSHLNNPEGYSNACSIRGSRGLLYSGVDIPVLNYTGTNQRTQKGGDNKNYILDAVSFNKYMIDKFGETPHKLEGAVANNPTEIAELLNGKNGIYVIINSSQNQAGYSGHVDAIINGQCIGGAYTGVTGGVKSIRVWELN